MYHLFNRKNGEQMEGLKLAALKKLAISSAAADLQYLWVWCEGMPDWLPLVEVVGSTGVDATQVAAHSAPAAHIAPGAQTTLPTAAKDNSTSMPVVHRQASTNIASPQPKLATHEPTLITQVTQVTRSLTNSNALNTAPKTESIAAATTPSPNPERRQALRRALKLRVIVCRGDEAFITSTLDVSLGGLRLMASLPQHLINQPVEIYLSHPDHQTKLLFTGSLLPESTAQRLKIKTDDDLYWNTLKQWLSTADANSAPPRTLKAAA